MKFGIKTEESEILAISRFKDDTVPSGYEEISEEKYDLLVKKYLKDKYGTYEEGEFKKEKKSKKDKRKIDRETRIGDRKKAKEATELKALAKKLKTLGISTAEIESIII